MSNSEKSSLYSSSFTPTEMGLLILRNGKIISPDETPSHMVERIVIDLSSIETRFGTPDIEVKRFAQRLGKQMDEGRIVFSTPIMTNADRPQLRPLSACTVPPVDLRGDLQEIRRVVNNYHEEAMGTGFDLSQVDDPVQTLLFLNEIAVMGAESGREDRPVGNMATCRVDHPKIMEFISSKLDRQDITWKFNISVDLTGAFWEAIYDDSDLELRNGKNIKARDILHAIAQSAHLCADPGIISLDRLNCDNPTPGVGLYTSTAPCAEVGMVPGETCQFGYLNLAKFINRETHLIDYEELAHSSELITRALDNALELSISRYSIHESSIVMSQKRKIGVGVCGLADMLVVLGIPYDSDEARNLCVDIVAFINYQTKIASVNLAKVRGSFGAMGDLKGCRYNENPGFLEQKYGNLVTNTISKEDWLTLGLLIRSMSLLRNCSTIALPPTGRSGLVVGASTGIEPLFSLISNGQINPVLERLLGDQGLNQPSVIGKIKETGSCKDTDLPIHIKKVYQTATEIDPMGHLRMIAAIQPCVDESISKTINLPNCATVEDIERIYLHAYKMGLKGMTIYRNGSVKSQPRKVAG